MQQAKINVWMSDCCCSCCCCWWAAVAVAAAAAATKVSQRVLLLLPVAGWRDPLLAGPSRIVLEVKLRLRVVINRTHDKDASGCGNRAESATLAESRTAGFEICHRLATTRTGRTCSGHLWHTRTGYVRLGKLAGESGAGGARGQGHKYWACCRCQSRDNHTQIPAHTHTGLQFQYNIWNNWLQIVIAVAAVAGCWLLVAVVAAAAAARRPQIAVGLNCCCCLTYDTISPPPKSRLKLLLILQRATCNLQLPAAAATSAASVTFVLVLLMRYGKYFCLHFYC